MGACRAACRAEESLEERALSLPDSDSDPLVGCHLVGTICGERLTFGVWSVHGRRSRQSVQGTRAAHTPGAFIGPPGTSVPCQRFGQEKEACGQGGGSLGLESWIGGVTMRLAHPRVMRPLLELHPLDLDARRRVRWSEVCADGLLSCESLTQRRVTRACQGWYT